MKRVVPVSFRVYALGARFLFVFFLAILLPPSDVGLYGLLASVAAYTVYALGMDMYTYTTREILTTSKVTWRTYLRSHSTFLLIVACVILPSSLLIFAFGILSWDLVLWFLLIAVSEHAGFEIDRLLVSMSRQYAASVVILIRQGAMPTVVVPAMLLDIVPRDLDVVFGAWILFNIAGAIVGLTLILRYAPRTRTRVDWTWIRRGIRFALPFLVGTLCLRLIFTADRQIVSEAEGLAILGAYTLAMTVANGMGSLLSVGVHQFLYPRLVKAVAARDRADFYSALRSLWVQSAAIIGVALVATSFLHRVIVPLLGEPIYVEWSWLIPATVGVMGIYHLSMVPHYALYAFRADRLILLATLAGSGGFFFTTFALIFAQVDTIMSVLAGLAAAGGILMGVKYFGYKRRSVQALRE